MFRRERDRVAELEARLDHERLYPLEWANRRVRDHFGDAVVAGPFAGLEFPDWGITHVDLFAPKLLGTYEMEVHPALERLIARAPHTVVNVGASDGYYAVGLARRLPGARVIAHELDERRRELLVMLAAHNGVEVEVHGQARPIEAEPGTLVVCDCDGCETEVLRPEGMAGCDVLVETHDLITPGITGALLRRFEATHRIERIPAVPRFVDDHPGTAFLPHVTRQMALLEFRSGPMEWLVMEAVRAADEYRARSADASVGEGRPRA